MFEDPIYGELECSEKGEIFFEVYSHNGKPYLLQNILEIENWSISVLPGMESAINSSFSYTIKPWISQINFGKIHGDRVSVEFKMFLISEGDYPPNDSCYKDHEKEARIFNLEATIASMNFCDNRIDQSTSYKQFIDAEVYDITSATINPKIGYSDHRRSYLVPLKNRRPK